MSDAATSAARIRTGRRGVHPTSRHPSHQPDYVDPVTLGEARDLYERTDVALAEIGRRTGLHPSFLYRAARREGWRRPVSKRPMELLAARLVRRIEKEIAAVEISLVHTRGPEGKAEARRSAELLASLMKTLREMRRFDREAKAAKAAEPAAQRGPWNEGDVDAMRDALSERLERLWRQQEIDEQADGEG